MEGSKRTTTCTGYLCSSTKKKQAKKNKKTYSYIQENQGVQTTCSYNLCCVSLKYGCVTCDSKGAKAATFGVNVHYSWHLIKP